MKALVYYGPQNYKLEEKEKPRIKKGEVLVKVIATGICGTDLKIFTHGHHAIHNPVTTGHEIVGEVVESKSDNQFAKVGEKVLVVTPVGCMKCRYCAAGKQNMCPLVADKGHSIGYYCDGGFAEYVRIPKDAVDQDVLIPIPTTTIPIEHFAICEPLSCVINGAEKLRITAADTVLVMGSGPIGCMHVSLAKAHGAKKIILTDLDEKKLNLAKAAPADVFIKHEGDSLKETIMEETNGEGADVIIIAAPSSRGQEDAIALAAPLGRISFFGGLPKTDPTITLNSNRLHYRELEIYGAYASTRKQYVEAMNLVLSQKIETSKLVTHVMPLSRIHEAIDLMKRGEAIKIILTP